MQKAYENAIVTPKLWTDRKRASTELGGNARVCSRRISVGGFDRSDAVFAPNTDTYEFNAAIHAVVVAVIAA